MLRGTGPGGAALVLLLVVAGCSVTPVEQGDAVATTPTTAVADGATEPSVPSGGLAEPAPDAEASEPGAAIPHAVPQVAPSDDRADIRVGRTELGGVLADADGFTLYAHVGDADGVPRCDADCADMWPAVLASEDLTVAPSLDDAMFGVADGPSGPQLTAGGRPLYRFAADMPGQSRGHALADAFFAVLPDGSLARN